VRSVRRRDTPALRVRRAPRRVPTRTVTRAAADARAPPRVRSPPSSPTALAQQHAAAQPASFSAMLEAPAGDGLELAPQADAGGDDDGEGAHACVRRTAAASARASAGLPRCRVVHTRARISFFLAHVLNPRLRLRSDDGGAAGGDNHLPIVNVVPDASALSGSGAAFPCPVPNCTRGFTRSQNLDLHLRTHGTDAGAMRPPPDPADAAVKRHYFCPVADCPCAPSWIRLVVHACVTCAHARKFAPRRPHMLTPSPLPCAAGSYALHNTKGLRFIALNKLKRHYQSKHGEDKSHVCAFCAKAHSTKDKQRTHEKWCHVKVWCVCGAALPSIEAMTANSKNRKGHLHQQRTCRMPLALHCIAWHHITSHRTALPACVLCRMRADPSSFLPSPPSAAVEGNHALDVEKMAAERAARTPGAYTHEARRKTRGAAGDAGDAGDAAGGLLAAGDGLQGGGAAAAAAAVDALLAAVPDGDGVPVGVPSGLPAVLDGSAPAMGLPLLGGDEEAHAGGGGL
jgi:hypothetical protein